ncbi:uncharacterized protein LOC111604934 [Drosophila hydei]|uniref:Uncharacterized protein LOC111604934 n=1 Tax=Drosophila hydei TaxID=7224 RepID=A0A6J1MHQ6_DROHY|nr:uncharacterized protein LOC111604934 [Drosophila hydei]
MKSTSLLLRLRSIWIMSSWLRHEGLAAAAMVVRRREKHLQRLEYEQKLESEAGEVGVDAQGRLRRVRVMDDYIIPAECGL